MLIIGWMDIVHWHIEYWIRRYRLVLEIGNLKILSWVHRILRNSQVYWCVSLLCFSINICLRKAELYLWASSDKDEF